ncbi:MAG: hypothetical protein PHS41_00220 [Victivallaceae bacterium]|nr:hypothetical protein [Victivallaceae bacterium]
MNLFWKNGNPSTTVNSVGECLVFPWGGGQPDCRTMVVSSAKVPVALNGDVTITWIAALTGDVVGCLADLPRYIETSRKCHLSVGESGLRKEFFTWKAPIFRIDAHILRFGAGKIPIRIDVPDYAAVSWTVNGLWNQRPYGLWHAAALTEGRSIGGIRRTEPYRIFSGERKVCDLVGCRRC